MEKEKRALIQNEVNALITKYQARTKEAKEKGNTVEALANATAVNAIYELSIQILTLDAKNLI